MVAQETVKVSRHVERMGPRALTGGKAGTNLDWGGVSPVVLGWDCNSIEGIVFSM